MSQCVVMTSTLLGVEGLAVEVQVDVGSGLPFFGIVGLGDLAVQEARERVRAALRASGFEFPNARVIVNLAPAPLRKHGTGFDLPIALALLVATGQAPRKLADEVSAVGELTLAGEVRPVPGLLAHALAARNAGRALLAARGGPSSHDLQGLIRLDIGHISQLRLGRFAEYAGRESLVEVEHDCDLDEIVGQEAAKRALIVAAAGGHNVLMVGPPGSGKTMLARRLPTILPALDSEERLQAALVHSVAGLDESAVLAGRRPFRAPHHSASVAGLVGGGSPPRPGEASLAHTGVLFLDEMPEFGPAALQTLRQPLEDGSVTLVRADARLRFPARFALVGAANPCPCGYFGDQTRACTCSAQIADRYRNRIGGPLLDRIDVGIRVDRVDPALLLTRSSGLSSDGARGLVSTAREHASRRGGVSASLSGEALLAACRLTSSSRAFLEAASRSQQLSGRAVTRLLRVARTIADLEQAEVVGEDHIAEALSLRAHDFRAGAPATASARAAG